MKKVYYFAYGSNLLIDKLKFRVDHLGEVTVYKQYNLMGWKLVFNCGWFHTFANIVKGDETDFVEGILYDLNAYQLKLLNEYEGLYETYYFDIDANSIACVYISTKKCHKVDNGKPELAYLNSILQGCADHGLTKTYLKLMKYKQDNYKLKSFKKI